jgi:hypothetical protein
MFGYSVTRPMATKDFFYDVFDQSALFKCDIEGWHTESGPGVFEAVSISDTRIGLCGINPTKLTQPVGAAVFTYPGNGRQSDPLQVSS